MVVPLAGLTSMLAPGFETGASGDSTLGRLTRDWFMLGLLTLESVPPSEETGAGALAPGRVAVSFATLAWAENVETIAMPAVVRTTLKHLEIVFMDYGHHNPCHLRRGVEAAPLTYLDRKEAREAGCKLQS